VKVRSPILWFAFLIVLLPVFSGICPCQAQPAHVDGARPIVAIWLENEGYVTGSQAPCLRVAIWEDGRVLFASPTNRWNHDLRDGRIEPARLDRLKQAIKDTGVFDAKETTYLVPSGRMICMMLDFRDRQQMLHWDEVETPGYGINIAPKLRHVRFKKRWKEVNELALKAIPQTSTPYQGTFRTPPASWRLKQPIQSN
jgi:hypothetical protein